MRLINIADHFDYEIVMRRLNWRLWVYCVCVFVWAYCAKVCSWHSLAITDCFVSSLLIFIWIIYYVLICSPPLLYLISLYFILSNYILCFDSILWFSPVIQLVRSWGMWYLYLFQINMRSWVLLRIRPTLKVDLWNDRPGTWILCVFVDFINVFL